MQTRASSIKRIPSLDGLRAVSIALVVALHSLQRLNLTHRVSWFWYVLADGATGVNIFFVISGYLITSLLLNEHYKRGEIGLRGFYLRRAFRILPPLYFYIGVLVALGIFGRLQLNRVDIVSTLLFARNYTSGLTMWSLEHTWSLAIEEQFYLLWPMILVLCLRRPGLRGRLLAARWALLVIIVEPVLRVAGYVLKISFLRIGGAFHLRADLLMFGCAAALLEGTPVFERTYRFLTRVWWLLPVTLFLISDGLSVRFQNYWDYPFGFTVTGVATVFFLLWCARNPSTWVGRFLNAAPVAHIGVLSYSIYIWQTLFLHQQSITVFGGRTPFNTWPGNCLAVILVAEFSYFCIEQPSLRLRDVFLRRSQMQSSSKVARARGEKRAIEDLETVVQTEIVEN